MGNIFLISNVLKLDQMIFMTQVLTNQFFSLNELGEIAELSLVGVTRLDQVSTELAEQVNKKIEHHFA